MNSQRANTAAQEKCITWRKSLLFFIVLPLILFVFSFANGQYPVSPVVLVKILISKIISMPQTWPVQAETVVFQVRLPRILGAMLVGACLSAAGVAYQGMFKNPLVSSDILGASAGAGFGASLALWLGMPFFSVQVCAFVFGMTAVLIVYAISSQLKDNQVMGLVLTGILIGTLFASGTSLLKYLADPFDKLPAITYWLMGSLAKVGFKELSFAFIPMLLGLIPLGLIRWRLNLLTMGEEEAQAMGANTRVLRAVVIVCATLVTVASVAMCGTVGWVGLVVPHLARMLVGHNFEVLLPTSIILGACYMLLVDDLARLMSTVEIPLSILTSFVGAPLFIYLILARKRGFSS